jgi:hypothetical protein
MQDLNKIAVAFAVIAVAASAYLYYTNSKDDVKTTSNVTKTVPAATTKVNATPVKAIDSVGTEAIVKTPTETTTEINSPEATKEGASSENAKASDEKAEVEAKASDETKGETKPTVKPVLPPGALEK